MAWAVSVTAVQQDPTPGVARVTLTFTDGARTIERIERVSQRSEIKRLAVLHIQRLTAQDEVAQEIATPTLGPISLTPPTPTPAEVARNAWLADYRLWVKVQQTLILTGIFTGNEAPLQTLKTRVQTNWQNSYINFI